MLNASKYLHYSHTGLFCLILTFYLNSGIGALTEIREDGTYSVLQTDDHLKDNLEAFYTPCPFPCSNFTEAFFAEANAVWFKVKSLTHFKPNGSNEQTALRIEIKRYCRFDISGTFASEHILVSAKEREFILEPEVGQSYVAAVIPNQLKVHAHDYRLVTRLVPADAHYPWKHLCKSCYFNYSQPNVLFDEVEDIDQVHACKCEAQTDSKPCKDVMIGYSGTVDVSAEYHQHAVLMTIAIVGVSVCGLFLIVGLASWRWQKYKERQRIQRSVVPRARGCQLDHPGPEVTGSPPANLVPLTRSQLPITMPLRNNNNITIQEEPQYRREDNRDVTIDFGLITRETSVTPLLLNISSPDTQD